MNSVRSEQVRESGHQVVHPKPSDPACKRVNVDIKVTRDSYARQEHGFQPSPYTCTKFNENDPSLPCSREKHMCDGVLVERELRPVVVHGQLLPLWGIESSGTFTHDCLDLVFNLQHGFHDANLRSAKKQLLMLLGSVARLSLSRYNHRVRASFLTGKLRVMRKGCRVRFLFFRQAWSTPYRLHDLVRIIHWVRKRGIRTQKVRKRWTKCINKALI